MKIDFAAIKLFLMKGSIPDLLSLGTAREFFLRRMSASSQIEQIDIPKYQGPKMKGSILFLLQSRRPHGEQRYAGVPGGAGGPPRRAALPGRGESGQPGGAGEGRHDAPPRRRPDGLPQLPQVDGE